MASMYSSPPSKSNLYKTIADRQTKRMLTERPSVSFKSLNKTNTTKDSASVIKKSKLFLAKNFVKTITPFLNSMKNIRDEKAHEKPSNTEIFYYSLRKFIKEQIGIDELMYAKNFPNRYYLQKKEELLNISTQTKNISFQQKEKEERERERERERKGKTKTFVLIKKNAKSQAMKRFAKLWKAIKERIDYKKKIKSELERLNPYYLISTSDAKFFANFYSATNDQIDKIRNKDLMSSTTNKKFYTNHDLKSFKLKECLLKKPIEKGNVSSSNLSK